MGMSAAGSSGGGRGGRHRRRRAAVMAEINVTPMVDVMLVLLIIFMVAAPLLTVGVPLDLPQTQAKTLDIDKEPITLSVRLDGKVFLGENTEIKLEELVTKLTAITSARGGMDERIFVRGDKKVDYGTVMRVMGRLSAAGFKRVALVTEMEQGSEPLEDRRIRDRQVARSIARPACRGARLGPLFVFDPLARGQAAGRAAGRHHLLGTTVADHQGHQERK
jgi:biopolymer transport protein TolR